MARASQQTDSEIAAPRDSAAFEVRDALLRPGCPICGLALRAVGRFIQSVAYEQVNDPDLRDALRTARGFCNVHARRWLREAHSTLGTAIIYRDVLTAALHDLEPRTGRRASNGVLRGLLSSGEPEDPARRSACPACRTQREAERRYLDALLQSLRDQRVASELEQSDGLCLVHARMATRRVGPGAERVLQRTRQAVQTLVGHLDEVIRKEDYRFRHEPRTPAEGSAPRRAVDWAAGAEGLVRDDT